MAPKAAFIGVNNYKGPLPGLRAANADARALHALFRDSIPDLDAKLLLDAAATHTAVRAELDRLLGQAAPDDTVFLTFAGHGTRNHELALFDSDPSVEASLIGMQHLAELFRASRARTIVCILDCCFSGAAPARVLAGAPRPRNFAIESWDALFTARGRVLIAACGANEAAWEDGSHGHLTRAVMETLKDKPLRIEDALRGIKDWVQREAKARQTVAYVNHVEGDWIMPRLVRGKAFTAEFPDVVGQRVTAMLASLQAFGIRREVLAAWARRFTVLNPLQMEAVNERRVLDGKNLLVIAPTGAGKTFVGELAAMRAIGQGKRAVFLLPYRALVNEKFLDFEALYGDQLRVIRCSGDYQDHTADFALGKYDIALLTYEMFLTLVLAGRGATNHFGVVVLDEAQFILDPERGITVELLLTLLLARGKDGPQIVALSAVIGDTNDFDAWLEARLLRNEARQVPLVEGVIDRTGQYQYLDRGEEKVVQFLPPAEQQRDVILSLARKLLADGETVLLFRNSRSGAQRSASDLAAQLQLAAAPVALVEQDPSASSTALRRCLAQGVGFHSSNLTREERVAVEGAFRAKGGLRVMAATSTLGAGVNTPASTVIIAENEYARDGRKLTVAEYKNMAGRAGRPGTKRGRAMLYAESPLHRAQLFDRYVRGTLEGVRSSFDPAKLDTWILRLLGQVDVVPKADVVSLLANTYGGYTASRGRPDWQPATREALQTLLDAMLDNKLLEEERGAVRLSRLGRACGQSPLSFPSCLRLVERLRHQGAAISVRDLMLLVQALDESDASYTPLGKPDTPWSDQLARRIGGRIARDLERGARDERAYQARCKRALLMLDWIAGTPIGDLERTYAVGRGDVNSTADLTRYHLRAASDIARIVLDTAPVPAEVEAMLRSLQLGVPASLHDLLELPFDWTRGELLALGVRTRAALWALPAARLAAVLPAARVAELQKWRPAAI